MINNEQIAIPFEVTFKYDPAAGYCPGVFTRADLAAAALVGPLLMPTGYGMDWGEVHEDGETLMIVKVGRSQKLTTPSFPNSSADCGAVSPK